MVRTYTGLIVALSMLTTSNFAFADLQESLVRADFRASVCNIDSMTIDFRITETFGEPLVTSKMRWTAGANTGPDCLSRLTHLWVRARAADDYAIRQVGGKICLRWVGKVMVVCLHALKNCNQLPPRFHCSHGWLGL